LRRAQPFPEEMGLQRVAAQLICTRAWEVPRVSGWTAARPRCSAVVLLAPEGEKPTADFYRGKKIKKKPHVKTSNLIYHLDNVSR